MCYGVMRRVSCISGFASDSNAKWKWREIPSSLTLPSKRDRLEPVFYFTCVTVCYCKSLMRVTFLGASLFLKMLWSDPCWRLPSHLLKSVSSKWFFAISFYLWRIFAGQMLDQLIVYTVEIQPTFPLNLSEPTIFCCFQGLSVFILNKPCGWCEYAS